MTSRSLVAFISSRLLLRGRLVPVALAALCPVILVSAASAADSGRVHGAGARQQARNAYLKSHGGAPSANHTGDDGDLADQLAAFDNERTAPASSISGAALVSAQQQAATLSASGTAWQEVTNEPYNAQPSNYTDPFWSNVGAGFSLVGGRTTGLAQTPDGDWFAGTADGGVWRSADQGQTWTPVFDGMPSLSIGAVAVDPADGSLWVGTGEANVSQDSYAGTGVYRSTDDGASFQRVGDDAAGNNPLVSHTTFRLTFDPSGNAYAATDNGLFRYATSTGQWTEVLDPAGTVDDPPYDQQVTDVALVPGSRGKDVIAAIGWHGPGNTQYNGFYESSDRGSTFSKVTPTGDINASDIGRTTFAYSADGSKLYAIVQSPAAQAAGAESVLQGIFVSSGKPASVAGPWTKIADEQKLAGSGSALAVGSGYGVGVQAWYNQDLAVDPSNPNHVYAGLEEVFESTDGGGSWVTASPYWNYPFACDSTTPTSCPNTTHPDQHAMMIAGGKIVIGNDGGVYSRPLSDTQQYGDWSDLNSTLRSWQYYDARAGALGGHGVGVWGGLQDNGTSLLATGSSQMVEPAGGDGFDVIVDPQNANNMVGEYTDGAMYSSTDGGHSFYDYVSPTCASQSITGITPRSDCDPAARFVTPLTMDQKNKNVWVTGGQYVWVTTAGWHTSCTDSACSWTNVFDTGAGHAVTALSSANNGGIIYAAWVAGGGNPGPSFASGIATNYGGSWHQVSTAGLPNRYIAGVTVDPSNPAHAYAIFNGYSRRWIPGGGVGHVFETLNGGQSWTDISGNLPDIASDALVLAHGDLALATDQGMFTAPSGQGAATAWSRLGTGLPDAAVNDVTVGPDGYIYAATHGRGIWRLPF
jgi:sugar lactone lactonase YvrE